MRNHLLVGLGVAAVPLLALAAYASVNEVDEGGAAGDAMVVAQGSGSQALPEVHLIDAGAEPRQTVRYQFVAGQTDTMVMTMRMRMSMSMGAQNVPEMQLPAMRMVMAISVSDVSPDGTYRYEFNITSADVDSADQVDANTASQLRAQLGQMVGLSGWARVDSRGFTLEGDINAPPGMDPAAQQLMQSVEQSINQLSAPLPEEPVGVGAHWEVVTHMAPSGFELTQTADMTLTAMTADTLSLNATLTQTAGSQQLQTPGMPPGAQATLNALNSTGTGTMTLDLHHLTPTSQMDLTTHMSSTVTMNGQSQDVAMDMGLNLDVAPQQQ